MASLPLTNLLTNPSATYDSQRLPRDQRLVYPLSPNGLFTNRAPLQPALALVAQPIYVVQPEITGQIVVRTSPEAPRRPPQRNRSPPRNEPRINPGEMFRRTQEEYLRQYARSLPIERAAHYVQEGVEMYQ